MKLGVTPINMNENDPFDTSDFLGRTQNKSITPEASYIRRSKGQ